MKQIQQFGSWTVEDRTKSQRVFLVSHPDYEGEYVLKKAYESTPMHGPNPHPDDERGIRRMENEIKALQRVTDHPNIINMVDYDLEAKFPWHVTKKVKHGNVSWQTFRDWPLERLQRDYIQSRFNDLAKAMGYLHSQGILLNNDIEIYLDEDDNFVIGDFELCTIWDNHHLDTSNDMLIMIDQLMSIKRFIRAARIKKHQEKRGKEAVQRAREEAQPSSPRRLAKK